MAFARVVSFDGVSKDRMQEMNKRLNEGDPPPGFPPGELIALHDAAAEKALMILILETEEDYKKADEILDAMPAGDTPGQRASVTKYDVVTRMKR
jgi:hypothetical protein